MELKCYLCGNEWDYGGDKDHYVTCTDCHRSIKKQRAREEYLKENEIDEIEIEPLEGED